MDQRSRDVPTERDELGVARSRTGLYFPVRHAQDLDIEHDPGPFRVQVDIVMGIPDDEVSFEHELEVDSGALTIGDPEGEELIEAPPGRYRVCVGLDEVEHAEYVRIWLSPQRDNQGDTDA